MAEIVLKKGWSPERLLAFDAVLAQFDSIKTKHDRDTLKPGNQKDTNARIKMVAKPNSWASGTGYGGSSGSGATTNQALSKAHEKELAVDSEIRLAMIELQSLVQSAPANVIFTKLASSKGAGLRWAFLLYLRNDSLVDIGNRKDCYRSIFCTMSTLARETGTAEFLITPLLFDSDKNPGAPPSNADSCFSLLSNLNNQSKVMVNLQMKSKIGAESDEATDELAMALHICCTYDEIEQSISFATECGLMDPAKFIMNFNSSSSSSSSSKSASTLKIGGDIDIENEYLSVIGPQRFEAVDMMAAIRVQKAFHVVINSESGGLDCFLRSGGSETSSNLKHRMLRINKEVSSMMSSLPVSFSSSIFIRCDETRSDVLKAIIIGPEGTPYENGCFEFDILLPADYPVKPPKVLLVTTGGGRVRFNPNLYNCGKVCLSLLGTWSGPSWIPDVSTLLQVLVSIQSMILVNDPYFNEPGHETTMTSANGMIQSQKYNATIRVETARLAILQQMKRPPVFFEKVVRDHFRIKRDRILSQIASWKIDSFVADQIRQELNNLAPCTSFDFVTSAPSASVPSSKVSYPPYTGHSTVGIKSGGAILSKHKLVEVINVPDDSCVTSYKRKSDNIEIYNVDDDESPPILSINPQTHGAIAVTNEIILLDDDDDGEVDDDPDYQYEDEEDEAAYDTKYEEEGEAV